MHKDQYSKQKVEVKNTTRESSSKEQDIEGPITFSEVAFIQEIYSINKGNHFHET